MKRLFVLLSILVPGALWAAGNQTALTVSSGTYQTIDMYSNANGSNRQAIVIGDRTSSATVTADAVVGLTVNIATSAVVPGAFPIISTNTLTISGTVSAQNISGGALAIISSKTLSVDGSGVTQPVSLTGIPLVPTGVNASSVAVVNGASALSVTANAGTNLNTSALALESGGNLATLAGGVSGSKYQTALTGFPLVPTGANASTTAVVNQNGQAMAIISTTTLNVSGSFSANGSSVTIFAPNNNTTAIPVTGSFSASSVNLSTYSYGGSLGSIGTAMGGVGPGGNFQTFAVDSSSQVKVTGSFSATSVSASTAATGGTPPGVVNMIGVEDGAGKAQKIGYSANDSSVPVNVSNLSIPIITTNTIPVSLSGNQAVNVAQINGVTPLMGNGATGTGSHRVTVSNDNTAIANWGQGATGSAVPSGASYQGGIAKTSLPSAATDGNLTGALRDKFGREVAILDCPRDLLSVATMTITASTAESVFISSGSASVFNDLVSVVALNTSATATRLDFRSGNFGGTISFALYLPAGETRGLTTSHVWPQSQSASQWTVTSSASVTDVRVYATYCADK